MHDIRRPLFLDAASQRRHKVVRRLGIASIATLAIVVVILSFI